MIRAFVPPYRKEDDIIRKERACVSWGDIDAEVCAVGAPVLGPDGRAIGALVLSAPSVRHDIAWANSMKAVVREAADKAAQSLRLLGNFSATNTPEEIKGEVKRRRIATAR